MDPAGTHVLPSSRLILKEEHEGRVARLILANPPDNALDLNLIGELDRALAALEGWPNLACVVLEGEGATFSTGLSPSHRRPPYGGELVRGFLTVARRLASLEAIQIAVLRGRSFGAGLELALLAHLILCDPNARLALPDANLGAFPLLAPLLLPERVGRTRAEEWIVSGRTFEPEEALAAGLITACPGGWENIVTLTERHVTQLLARPVASTRSLARSLSATRAERLERELPDLERLFEERVAGSAEFAEGLSAALRGRAPRWSRS